LEIASLIWESKNIILDFDGVIADSEEFQLAIWTEVLMERDFPTAHLTVNTIAGIPDRVVIERAYPGLMPELYDELRAVKVQRHRERLVEVKPVPGIQSFIEKMSGKKDLFICSSSPVSVISDFIASHLPGIAFKLIIGKGDYQHIKPHPEPYLKTVERAGIKPQETLVIEDSQAGVKSALAAGLRVIHLNRYGQGNGHVPTVTSAWELSAMG
jgi:HAD superfamily hydrolase (TIGR01509 family)